MSRHRNVRALNIDEECEGYDDIYGHSMEDDFCVSPGTAAQFTYNRDSQYSQLSSFMKGTQIQEEEEEAYSDHETDQHMSDSGHFQSLQLSDIDKGRLHSCLEEINNIIGDTIPESKIVDAVIASDYNMEKALDKLLNQSAPVEAPLPQRVPRDNRRNRDDSLNICITQSPPLLVKPPPGLSRTQFVLPPPGFEKPIKNVTQVIRPLEMNEEESKDLNQNLSPKKSKLSHTVTKESEKAEKPSFSLADLAKQHSSITAPVSPLSKLTISEKSTINKDQTANKNDEIPKLSLQQLAEKHGASPQSKSSVLSPKDLSLSELAGRHQSSPKTTASSPRTTVSTPKNVSLSELAQQHKLSSSPKSNLNSSSPKNISLFEIASKHSESKTQGLTPPKSTGLSLSDLAKNHSSPFKPNFGLNVLEKSACKDSPKYSAREEKRDLSLIGIIPKSKEQKSDNLNFSLDSLKESLSEMSVKLKEKSISTKGHKNDDDDNDYVDNEMEIFATPTVPLPSGNITDDIPDYEMTNVSHLTKAPSPFGIAICRKRKINQKRLDYLTRKINQEILRPCSDVAPFDFSTPSPDDIVLEKQKAAFGKGMHSKLVTNSPDKLRCTALDLSC